MVKKIRLTRTMAMEYVPNPDHYPEGATIEEMAQIDASTDDPDLLFYGENVSDTITWEIVDDKNQNEQREGIAYE